MSDGNFSIAHVAFVKIFVQLSNASKLADQIGVRRYICSNITGGPEQFPVGATGDVERPGDGFEHLGGSAP